MIATTWGLQSVKNFRRDVLVVNTSQLGAEGLWYDRLLQRRHPELRLPTSLPESKGRARRDSDPIVSAFLVANVAGPRPLYVTSPLAVEFLPPGTVMVPDGVLWRLAPKSEDRVRPEHWQFPLEPEQVPALYRRKRGLAVKTGPDGFECEFEPYERRLQKALLRARTALADWQFRHGQPVPALSLYESVLPQDPSAGRNEGFLHNMALCALAVGKNDEAGSLFRRVLELTARPWTRASSLLALGDMARARGDGAGARQAYEEAARVSGLTPEQAAEVRKRLAGP